MTADGATWIPGGPDGPLATRDAGGHYWQLKIAGAVNARWFGAAGDDVTDDTAAENAAAAWANTDSVALYNPAGVYLLSNQIALGRAGLQGDGEASTRFHTRSYDGSLFLITVDKTSLSDNAYQDFTCRNEIGPTDYTSSACFEVAGDGTSYFQYNRFANIASEGFFAFMKVTKKNQDGYFGHESRYSVNLHTNISILGWSNPGRYGWWFLTGSGTANVFSHIRGFPGANVDGKGHNDPRAALWRYEGRDPGGHGVVVGDITIDGSQFQGPQRLVSIGAGSIYNENIGLGTSQFDGAGTPIAFDVPSGTVPQGLSLSGDNIGGGIDIYGGVAQPIQDSVVADRQASSWSAGVTSAFGPGGRGATAIFKVELAANTATACTILSAGNLGDASGTGLKNEYILQRSGPTIHVIPIGAHFGNPDGGFAKADGGSAGAGAISLTSSVSGSTVLFSLSFPPTSGKSAFDSQIECKGGAVQGAAVVRCSVFCGQSRPTGELVRLSLVGKLQNRRHYADAAAECASICKCSSKFAFTSSVKPPQLQYCRTIPLR